MTLRKHLFVLLLVLFFAPTALAADGPSRSARKNLKKGISAYEKADYAVAAENLTKAVEEFPGYADAWFHLGQVALAESNVQQAFAYLNKAVESDPAHTDAQLALGRLLMAARMPEEAVVHAEAILKNEPTHQDATLLKASALMSQKRTAAAAGLLSPLYDRGLRDENLILLFSAALFRQDDADKADAVLRAGIKKHPKSVALLLQQRNLYLRKGELAQAQAVMEKVVRIAPGHSAYAIALARLYRETDAADKADALLANALADDPDDAARRIGIANFYLEQKKIDQAEQLLRDGIATGDPDAALRLALGELLIKKGDAQAAVDLLQKGLETAGADDSVETINLRNALARLYLAAKSPEAARTHAEKVLIGDPDNLQALVNRGLAYKATGQLEAAIADFKRVLRRKPGFVDGYVQLADVHLLNRQPEEARQTLDLGLRLAPDNRALLMSAYRVNLSTKDYKQAEAHLRHLVETDPHAIDVQAELGDFYLLLNDESSARREYSEIVLKAPGNALGHLRLARLYQRQGAIDDALAQLRKGYAVVRPNDVFAAEITGVLLHAKRYDDALAFNDDRLAADADDALAHDLKGKTYAAMEKYDAAKKAFEKALKLSPEWSQAGNDLASLFILMGKQDKAIAQFETTLSHNPNNPVGYLTLGRLYEEKKQIDKAITTYKKGVAKVPGFWRAANRLAFLLADGATAVETLDEAMGYATAAYRLEPGQAAIIDTLGWIQFKKGETEKALALYERLIAAAPQDPVVNYHLGVILQKKGDLDAARTHLETATKAEHAFSGREHAEALLKSIRAKKG